MSTADASIAPGSPLARSAAELTTRAPRRNTFERLRIVWRHRELLRNLVRKELKVKYKSSVLGFVWTLLNPALYLVVFSIVFKFILQSAVPYFAIFLLSGLLAWNLFSAALSGGTTSIVANAPLVQKVWMPREILPLASIGAALMHFLFQLSVLIGALLIFRRPMAWSYLPLLLAALVVLLVFVSALAVAFSAMNVYLRDIQHLLELVLLAWFWFSPIVYPYQQVAARLGQHANVLLLNPMIPIIVTFQKVIYNPAPSDHILPPNADAWWYARNLGIIGVASIVLFFVAMRIFARLEDNLAEEI